MEIGMKMFRQRDRSTDGWRASCRDWSLFSDLQQ